MTATLVIGLLVMAGIVEADLVAYWDFDDAWEGVVRDKICGREGTFNGVVTRSEGHSGQALKFGPPSGYVSVAYDPVFDFTDAMTVAAWIKVDAFDRPFQTIITRGRSRWSLSRYRSSSIIRFAVFRGIPRGEVDRGAPGGERGWGLLGQTSVDDGKWHHIVGAYDGARASLYVDGRLDASLATSVPIPTGVQDIYIGTHPKEGNWQWNGLIDELLIFDHGLSEPDIKELYHQGAQAFLSKAMGGLCGASVKVEEMLKDKKPEEVVIFLGKNISEYESSKPANAKLGSESREDVLSRLYFVLAQTKDKLGAPKKEISHLYMKSVSLGLGQEHYVPALLWLHVNVPAGEYAQAVRGSLKNSENALDALHRIVGDFESCGDWDAFESFLKTLLTGQDDPGSSIQLITNCLRPEGTWVLQFLEYCSAQPQLKDSYLQVRAEQGRAHLKKGNYHEAEEIYQQLVRKCGPTQDPSPYEFGICECLFNSGRYSEALSALDGFIKKYRAVNESKVRDGLVLKGRAHMLLQDFDQAHDIFMKCIAEYPRATDLAAATFYMGYCDMVRGKHQQAVDVFSKLLKNYSESPFANRARLCLIKLDKNVTSIEK